MIERNYPVDMTITLELERMSVEDKLRAMEVLWDDLSRRPEQLASPAWHGDVLTERSARVESGEAKFLDWDAVREELLGPDR